MDSSGLKRKERNDELPCFLPVLAGGLALYHRPGKRQLEALVESSPLSTVLTLGGADECPFGIRDLCELLKLK